MAEPLLPVLATTRSTPKGARGAMKKKILIVLPSPIMARNVLRSDFLHLMREGGDLEFTVVSPGEDDRQVIEAAGGRWLPYYHPRRSTVGNGFPVKLKRWAVYSRYLAGFALHMSLTHRFNVISGFRGFAGRLKQSWPVRKVYVLDGLPMSALFGFPFPRSRAVYGALRRLYYSGWQSFGTVNRLVADLRPDLVVMSMIQTHMVTPYALAAIRAGVPVLGVNGSWDQPTTKGPLCPGISRIVTQNEIVREELIGFHGIPASQIGVIGWLQMDAYVGEGAGGGAALLERIGIPQGRRYILFAANAPRLGPHEPDIVKELAARVQANEFGDDVVLLCRCHPQDTAWRERWNWASSMERVIVQPPDLGPLEELKTIISNAGVVLASAGSINLDAVALDAPNVGVAWEDGELPYWDRPARAYDLEHLAELRTSQGIAFAGDMPSLVAACRRYLSDRSADAEGRAHLRERYLYRLDGKAAERLYGEVRGLLE